MIAGWYTSAEGNVVAEVGERNLKIRRDWGLAPEYVEGMRLILRQISVRAERGEALADEGRPDRHYLLGTGRTHAVWEL